MNCEYCRYYDVDYEWDDDYDEELEIDICKKGHDIDSETKKICPDFKKYKPKKYIEKDTECDKCEFLSYCIKHSEVLDCTISLDKRNHYICGMGVNCKKHGRTS